MPSEKDLRDLFAAEKAPNTLDAQRIIARSRARRLPRQFAAGAIGALAIAGVGVLAVQVAQFQPPASVMTLEQASDAPAEGSDAADTGIKRVPVEKLNPCGGTLAEVVPSTYGLQLDVAFPATAPAGTDPVQGVVRLTNTSAIRVSGTTAASPAITLSQDGAVLWHSNGPMIMSVVVVDLTPGESLEYPAWFTPVRCGVEDDVAESFGLDLPAVAPGTYDLSAAIYFTPDASMPVQDNPELDLVTGPRSTITLG